MVIRQLPMGVFCKYKNVSKYDSYNIYVCQPIRIDVCSGGIKAAGGFTGGFN
ncbi:hypothetical protein DESC_660030 [Desulfosarcina cetonica]|nr:hypothetical protein DESC_660030 [Desulfosarcina cetonica]